MSFYHFMDLQVYTLPWSLLAVMVMLSRVQTFPNIPVYQAVSSLFAMVAIVDILMTFALLKFI